MTAPGKNRPETMFIVALTEQFPHTQIMPQYHPVDCHCLDKCVDRDKVVVWLEADTLLPPTRRAKCIEILKGGPSQLRVALEPSKISFDFVVVQNGQPYYWEFHERQHRELKKNRPWRKVFGDDGSAFDVPRYLQRLIRDVWRVLYFRPYTIVWSDWFVANQETYQPTLQDGLREFYLSGRFSFQEFCQISEGT